MAGHWAVRLERRQSAARIFALQHSTIEANGLPAHQRYVRIVIL
jgi:hypothetical protein